MAAHHRQQPSRLFIPPNLHSQLAGQMDTRTMFSPALQTAHQPGFPPLQTAIPFQPNFSLNTPIQGSFFAAQQQQQGMQQRPMHIGHRPNGSIAHGPLQPAVPMTPFGSQFPPQMLHSHGLPPNMPNGQPFIPKSRRTPSMIGGPPKAALGGPNRKVTPLAPTGQAALIAEKLKSKKLAVRLPLESMDVDELSDGTRRSLWSRHPEPIQRHDSEEPIRPPTLSTGEIFPDETQKFDLPPSIEICLPLPSSWDDMKQREIDEKLEKLGIERRSDSALASIHGRASSISSPADPALLLFKLNRLHQQQSATSSIATSPQLPYGSPGHGHSMSMAPGGSHHSPAFGALGRISGVVSPRLLGDNMARSPVNLHAPQGRIPAQLTVPTALSRSESRPDFARGFGLDVTEEEEEEEEEAAAEDDGEAPAFGNDCAQEEIADAKETVTMSGDIAAVDPSRPEEVKVELTSDVAEDSVSPVKASTHHKHPSRVSVSLSVSSRKNAVEPLTSHSRHSSVALPALENLMNNEVNALNEWTGSESVDIVSDSEGMDEWSNPSDEERMIKERAHAANMRRLHLEALEQEQPRRLPEFPRPPEQRPVSMDDDDDIISNPSDEERRRSTFARPVDESYPPSGVDPTSSNGRPLPPVPHSREPSYQYSYYGSLPAHSREPSANQLQRIVSPEPEPSSAQALQVPPHAFVPSKKDLNPFAKPFVFGGRPSFAPTASPSVPVSVNSEAASSPAQSSAPAHSRNPSHVGAKTLNATAQEFKPSGFTFQAPEGVPKLAFPEPVTEPSRPLPQPPVIIDPRILQGREKRLKASVSDIENETESEQGEGHDSMASFRFPVPSDHATFAKSAPTSPGPSIAAGRPTANTLSVNSKPFTFSGFSSMPPVLPPLLGQEQHSLTDTLNATDFLSIDATRGSALVDDRKSPDLTLPSIHKQKRAPIPLDFTHPISTNKAPAGLFKNVAANANLDSARTPRSFGGLYDRSDDRSDISLDDLTVPPISGTMNRRPVHQPEDLDASEGSEDDYGLNRSEDADAESAASSAGSESRPGNPLDRQSYMQPEIASYSQGLRLEDRIETTLRQKMDEIIDVVSSQRQGNYISSNTDELVREAMAMFRTQLRDSASKAMEDSVMDASGELDFKMIADIVEQGHVESRRLIQSDIAALMQIVQKSNASEMSLYDLGGEVRELKASLSASNNAIRHQLAAIGESTRNHGQFQDRDGLVADILAALAPHFTAIRSEPIDYDGLTLQLSQAVKPHISQLIDLASDKRETAGLIVERLTPILESLETGMTASDTANLVSAITASVNRAIAPIDTYAIKEQVADLVVERLDSRLATRDNDASQNFSEIKSKMSDQIAPILTHFDLLEKAMQNMCSQQGEMTALAREVSSKRDSSDKLLLELSEKMSDVVRLSTEASAKIKDSNVSAAFEQQLSQVNTAIGVVTTTQENSSKNLGELFDLCQETSARLAAIPELISSSTTSRDSVEAEILAQLKALASSSQETRKFISQNSDLQSQLSKARSQHGQIRVQYETVNAKFSVKENECDELKARIAELEAVAASRNEDFVSLEKRNVEQEQAMHAALERLKASDVDAQTRQEKSSKLEKDNKDLMRRSLESQSKIESLEMQISFADRDKEKMQRSLTSVEEERDRLVAQQAQLDDLRRTSEQVEALAKLIAKNDSEELTELRYVRDQSKVLQFEHDALKKRFKEQEAKVSTAERSALNIRQSLEQAQKRAADWEEKARLFEAEVERLTTALDQAEQTKGQLDADFSLAKLQLEEKEAEDRIAKDRERKLAEEVANLKTQLNTLTSDLEEERKTNRSAVKNARPTSRSSTTYEASEPPTPKMNGKMLPARSPTPKSSTWDSIHAPRTARVAYVSGGGKPVMHSQRTSYYNSRAASPAPSAISTVTQDADGWFS